MMAQIHYKMAADDGKPKYARYGYFFILTLFAVLSIAVVLAVAYGGKHRIVGITLANISPQY